MSSQMFHNWLDFIKVTEDLKNNIAALHLCKNILQRSKQDSKATLQRQLEGWNELATRFKHPQDAQTNSLKSHWIYATSYESLSYNIKPRIYLFYSFSLSPVGCLPLSWKHVWCSHDRLLLSPSFQWFGALQMSNKSKIYLNWCNADYVRLFYQTREQKAQLQSLVYANFNSTVKHS